MRGALAVRTKVALARLELSTRGEALHGDIVHFFLLILIRKVIQWVPLSI